MQARSYLHFICSFASDLLCSFDSPRSLSIGGWVEKTQTRSILTANLLSKHLTRMSDRARIIGLIFFTTHNVITMLLKSSLTLRYDYEFINHFLSLILFRVLNVRLAMKSDVPLSARWQRLDVRSSTSSIILSPIAPSSTAWVISLSRQSYSLQAMTSKKWVNLRPPRVLTLL